MLAEHCYKCHSRLADKIKGGLMLDTREGMLHGGDTGPAIEPGKPEDSLIIDAISYKDADLQMPPKGEKLTDQQVADITQWIRMGAPDPRSLVAKGSSSSYGGVGREHWSFLPVRKQAVPAVSDAAWCRTPVDNFILGRLEENRMKPNPPADKYTLIRRASFDLTGLPPTEEEVQRYLADDSPEAWAKVVDRLLASPRYGERWGRYWLDVARYADTKGDTPQKEDPRYPFAWTYRDYVIEAFNTDKPYDVFITEQLAADRIMAAQMRANRSEAPDQRPLAALGFLTLGNRFENSTNDIINDRIDVTTKAFLGLTVSCARCHDHKFDPIPTADYYSLYNVFANSGEPKEEPWLHPVEKTPALVDYLTRMQAAVEAKAGVQLQIRELRRSAIPVADRPAKRRELLKQLVLAEKAVADLESSPEAPPKAEALLDIAEPRDYPVLLRGEAQNKGPMTTRHFLSILSPDPKHPIPLEDGSGRLELARAIASPSNPMTARVLVNRVWQQHFGTGFVSTPDDLGNQSAPPTNPELLDYLAGQFCAGRLVDQAAPAPDHAQQRLPGIQQGGPRVRRVGPGQPAAVALKREAARLRADARLDPRDRGHARPDPRGKAGPHRQRGLRDPARGLRVHRQAQPGRDSHAVQFPQPQRPHGQALPDAGSPAAALPHEQPPRDRDGPQAHPFAGVPRADDGRAARGVPLHLRLPAPPDPRGGPPLPGLRRVEPWGHLERGRRDGAVREGLPLRGDAGKARRKL